MTQYNIREDAEKSMWLTYKGNAMLSWDSFDIQSGDSTESNISLPWRRASIGGQTRYLDLYIRDATWAWNMKKAELNMSYQDTYEDRGDEGEGMKLQSSDAASVTNGCTISGVLEDDMWRNEESVFNSELESGVFSPGLTLDQKILLAQNMCKRSGVQDPGENSYELHPVSMFLNWGYNHYNWKALLAYLKGEGLTYAQARKQLQEKWMPGYVHTWDWYDAGGFSKSNLYKGNSAVGISGRLPASRVEMNYDNCVVDSLRLTDSAKKPNRIGIEITLLFDTNNLRWDVNGDYTCQKENFGYTFTTLQPKAVPASERW